MRYSAGAAVAGDTSSTDPTPFYYRGPIRPRVTEQPNGKFTVHDIPIFETHDNRGWPCDEQWMQKAVEQQRRDRNKGWNPRLILGHTPDDPDGEEKPVVGFLDNFRFSASEGWLYADFVDVPEHVMERFRDNEFPGRSVEVIPSEYSISAVAVLGGSKPFFKLPDLRFSDHPDTLRYSVMEQNTMPSDKKHDDNGSDVTEEMREMIRKEVAAAVKQATGKGDKNAADDETGNTPGEQEEPGEKDKNMGDHKNKNEGAAEPEKYADPKLKHDYDQLSAKHEELRQNYDKLQGRLADLEYQAERQKWEQKYDALRIPPGVQDREQAIEHILSVPQAQREPTFQLYQKLSRSGPSTRPADLADSDADAGVENFADQEQAIRDFYNANRQHYRGDFGAARRDFIAKQKANAAGGE